MILADDLATTIRTKIATLPKLREVYVQIIRSRDIHQSSHAIHAVHVVKQLRVKLQDAFDRAIMEKDAEGPAAEVTKHKSTRVQKVVAKKGKLFAEEEYDETAI